MLAHGLVHGLAHGLVHGLVHESCRHGRREPMIGQADDATLDHERLDVQQRAIEFLVVAVKVIEAFPRGNGGLRDQLRRAAISIPSNIAEGSARPGDADRARFYALARGSAMECAAILDVCAALGGVDAEPLANGKALLERIVAMLTKLCR